MVVVTSGLPPDPLVNACRVVLPPRPDPADGNITSGHPAERAYWLWAPGRERTESAFLHFSCSFGWATSDPLRFHVTADHRYQLFLDGEPLSYGPDRSDVPHWAVTSLEVALPTGDHRLEALVWFLAENAGASRMDPKHAGGDHGHANPPMAQMSYRPGFLLCGPEDASPQLLDTGAADWKVADLTDAVTLRSFTGLGYHDIGPGFGIDLGRWCQSRAQRQEPVIVGYPPAPNIHGVRQPGWVLTGTPLPEQQREVFTGGTIRAQRAWSGDNDPWTESPGDGAFGKLLGAGEPVEIAPHQAVEVLWDFESYQCGYPHLQWSGGETATLSVEWAESLYLPPSNGVLDAETPKGHRGMVDGKVWLGFGDDYICSGAAHEGSPAPWWRSGRYVRLRIRTAEEPLRLERLAILTTGYPLERGWSWQSSDAAWDEVLPLIARGLELGAHEVWADSPYYEQMAYVGDNALHMLSNYAGYRDLRLTRRALELFDWSRDGSLGGLVAERYPSNWRQESTTYAMLYPGMLRNHLWWRGDEDFLRQRLPGVRQLMDSLLALRGRNVLLGRVPGWPFIDWVPAWHQGCGPGVREGDSSIVNLHLVLALQAAADLEEHLGESLMARRWTEHADKLAAAIWNRYAAESHGLVADTPGCGLVSEHAQVLALLTGRFPTGRAETLVRTLADGVLEARCTVYFSHYFLEVLAAQGESDAFFRRLEFWKALPSLGFTALPESPEPSRSDCHGWGAHPLFHTLASIAGIRPGAPGFRTAEIRPMPGPLTRFEAKAVHPDGEIRVAYRRGQEVETFEVDLPAGVTGVLTHRGRLHELAAGASTSIESKL